MNEVILSATSGLFGIVLGVILTKNKDVALQARSEKRLIYNQILLAMQSLKSDCSNQNNRTAFTDARTLFLITASSKLVFQLREYEQYILDNNKVELNVLEKYERNMIRLMRSDLGLAKWRLRFQQDLPDDVYLYDLK